MRPPPNPRNSQRPGWWSPGHQRDPFSIHTFWKFTDFDRHRSHHQRDKYHRRRRGPGTAIHRPRPTSANSTSVTKGKHFAKFGARLRVYREADSNNTNFNGMFCFPPSTPILPLSRHPAKPSFPADLLPMAAGHLNTSPSQPTLARQPSGCPPFHPGRLAGHPQPHTQPGTSL